MLRTLAVSTLLLGSTIAFAQPPGARGRSDNRTNNGYSYRDNRASGENRAPSDNRGYRGNRGYDRGRNYEGAERGEWQEHERFENRRVPYASSYRSGYRDQRFGYGDQRFGYGDQRYGYYDRFGNWCWY